MTMNRLLRRLAAFCLAGVATSAHAANPIVPGWYADPEIRIFNGRYWIYPTYSADQGAPDRSKIFTPAQQRMRARSELIWEPFLKSTFFNAFSSPDLVHWTKHPHVTPDPEYVEGSFMVKRKGVYYFMWSEGEWTGPGYSVAYAMSASPLGPFKRIGKILQQDDRVARGAGHHSVVNVPGTDQWYIAYHRRPLTEVDGNHREIAIEPMFFNEDGTIRPVVMTTEGVAPRPSPPVADR